MVRLPPELTVLVLNSKKLFMFNRTLPVVDVMMFDVVLFASEVPAWKKTSASALAFCIPVNVMFPLVV